MLRPRSSACSQCSGSQRPSYAARVLPQMSAGLEALVGEEDLAAFLSELERSPSEALGCCAEAARDAPRGSSSEEVMSGAASTGGGGRFDPAGSRLPGSFGEDGAESGRYSRAPEPTAAAGSSGGDGTWNIVHAGSTGTGTNYRLLRRNGPAPGTTQVGPARYCSPRHPTSFEPSSLKLHDIL